MKKNIQPVKNKNFLYLFLALLLVGGWFYWIQIRPANIRKNCYIEAYVLSKTDTKWAEGKVWRYVGDFGRKMIWGWAYAGDSEEAQYNNCLLSKGIKP